MLSTTFPTWKIASILFGRSSIKWLTICLLTLNITSWYGESMAIHAWFSFVFRLSLNIGCFGVWIDESVHWFCFGVAGPFICVNTRVSCGFGDINPGWWAVTTVFMAWQSDICRPVSWSALISLEDVSPFSNKTSELSDGLPSPISSISPEFTDMNPIAARCRLSHSFKLLSNCSAWPSKECRALRSVQACVFAFPGLDDNVFVDEVVSDKGVSNLCFLFWFPNVAVCEESCELASVLMTSTCPNCTVSPVDRDVSRVMWHFPSVAASATWPDAFASWFVDPGAWVMSISWGAGRCARYTLYVFVAELFNTCTPFVASTVLISSGWFFSVALLCSLVLLAVSVAKCGLRELSLWSLNFDDGLPLIHSDGRSWIYDSSCPTLLCKAHSTTPCCWDLVESISSVLTCDFGHEDNWMSASMSWGKSMVLIDEQIKLDGVSAWSSLVEANPVCRNDDSPLWVPYSPSRLKSVTCGTTPWVFRSREFGLMQFRVWTWLVGWWTLIWSAADVWQFSGHDWSNSYKYKAFPAPNDDITETTSVACEWSYDVWDEWCTSMRVSAFSWTFLSHVWVISHIFARIASLLSFTLGDRLLSVISDGCSWGWDSRSTVFLVNTPWDTIPHFVGFLWCIPSMSAASFGYDIKGVSVTMSLQGVVLTDV